MVNIFTDLYYLTFVQELNKSLSTWQPTLLPNSKGQGLGNPSALSSKPQGTQLHAPVLRPFCEEWQTQESRARSGTLEE